MTAWSLLVADALLVAVFLSLSRHGVRHRERPGAVTAGALWLALAAVAGVLAGSRARVFPPRAALYAVLLGWAVTVPLWSAFVFAHTGRGPTVTRQRGVVAVSYVVATVVTALEAGNVGGMLGQLLRISTSVLQTSVIGVGVFGVFLVVRSAVKDDLPIRQAIALSLGGLGVSLLVFSVSAVSSPEPEPLPMAITGFFGLTAGGFALAVLRYRMFSETPRTGPLARRTIFEEIGEAVVVTDREQRLVDANERAERTLDFTVAHDASRPVTSVLGFDVETAAGSTTTVRTPTGQRTYDVSRSVLTNRQNETVGAAYLLRDATGRQTREQRLEVFNRVLRHNLRNDLDAIRGFADALADDTVDKPEDVASRIETTATELVDVGETVKRANQLMTRDDLANNHVDVPELVGDVAATIEERYDCQTTVVSETTELSVRTDQAVLRTALFEVIENAVEHSKQAKPTVTAEATPTDGGVRITVRDDGPGIPERERAVLLEGEETPLQHGTGVGLWFVSWAVTRLGGNLAFTDTDGTGSGVVLEIPDRRGDR